MLDRICIIKRESDGSPRVDAIHLSWMIRRAASKADLSHVDESKPLAEEIAREIDLEFDRARLEPYNCLVCGDRVEAQQLMEMVKSSHEAELCGLHYLITVNACKAHREGEKAVGIYDDDLASKVHPTVSQCCKCKRYVDKKSREYTDKPEGDSIFSHTYCEPCAEEMRAEIDRETLHRGN